MVTLKRRASASICAANEDVYVWDEDTRESALVDLRATGYADSRNQLPARVYGEAPERALVMYSRHDAALAPGMGVCVEADASQSCDYRVTGMEDWPGHKRAYLAWIPENRRG
jgi:hypothetical protein